MSRLLVAVFLASLTSPVAHAKTAAETCESIRTVQHKRECLAYIAGDASDCNAVTAKDRCKLMMKYVRVPGNYSKCSVYDGEEKTWCVSLTKRNTSECRKIRTSDFQKACFIAVDALRKHDSAGETGETLMTVEAFRTATSLRFSYFRPRNNVIPVEQALADFNRQLDTAPTSVEKILGLMEVLAAVEAYDALDSSARDLSGLSAKARTEIDETIDGLVRQGDADALKLLRAIASESERGLRNLGRRGAGYANATAVQGMKELQKGLGDRAAAELQAADQDSLQDLAQAGTTPRITAVLLGEMRDIARDAGVRLSNTSGGSSAGVDPKSDDGGYVVQYGQNQPDDIRLGTMVHELTHVASAQAFGNTPLMFSYPRGKSKAEIQDIMDDRMTDMRGLIGLANSSSLNAYQKHWIIDDKLEYSLQKDGKVIMALGAVKDTDDDAKLHFELAQEIGGLSQVLWEYETVLNQILVYLAHWEIDPGDAFYKKVQALAGAAQIGRRG